MAQPQGRIGGEICKVCGLSPRLRLGRFCRIGAETGRESVHLRLRAQHEGAESGSASVAQRSSG